MVRVTVDFLEKELEAIKEYSNQCDEDLEELIKKICLTDATFDRHLITPDKKYHYKMKLPSNISSEEEDRIIQDNHNKIRKILGMKKIRI